MTEKHPQNPNFMPDIDWAVVQGPQVGVPQAPGIPSVHTPGGHGSGEHVTSSGARTWEGTLQHWGVTEQGSDLPGDTRANTLPFAYDAAREMHSTPQPEGHRPGEHTKHVTSSGARDWDGQRRHWGLS